MENPENSLIVFFLLSKNIQFEMQDRNDFTRRK